MICHFYLLKWLNYQTILNAGKQLERLHIANGSVKQYNNFGNTIWPCNIISEYLPQKYKYAYKSKKKKKKLVQQS